MVLLFTVTISGREVRIKDILVLNGPTLATVPMRVRIEDSADVLELVWALVPEFWEAGEAGSFWFEERPPSLRVCAIVHR